MSQESDDFVDVEFVEDPVVPAKIEMMFTLHTGNYHQCYICGRDLSKLEEKLCDRRSYGTGMYSFVLSFCVWCGRQHLTEQAKTKVTVHR